MALNDFKEKFGELIKILTTNEEIAQEFSSIDTVDDSFDFACRLVGKMDRIMYHEAVRAYIDNLDSDQENVFDGSLEDSSYTDASNANSFDDFGESGNTDQPISSDDNKSMDNSDFDDQKSVFNDSANNSVKNDVTTNSDVDSSDDDLKDYSSKIHRKKSSYDYDSTRNGYKKLSSYDEKRVSGGMLFRHHKMRHRKTI